MNRVNPSLGAQERIIVYLRAAEGLGTQNTFLMPGRVVQNWGTDIRINRGQPYEASSDSSSESGAYDSTSTSSDEISDTSSDFSGDSEDFTGYLVSRVSVLFKAAGVIALLGVAATKTSLVFAPGYALAVLEVTISVVTVVAFVALYELYKHS